MACEAYQPLPDEHKLFSEIDSYYFRTKFLLRVEEEFDKIQCPDLSLSIALAVDEPNVVPEFLECGLGLFCIDRDD